MIDFLVWYMLLSMVVFLLAAENRWYGVNSMESGICDTFEKFIWEPTLVKMHAIQAATEVRSMKQ